MTEGDKIALTILGIGFVIVLIISVMIAKAIVVATEFHARSRRRR